ncbi:MAG: hypothetical protein ACYTEQ_01155 [Planctomycetota bacterium]|jgi:hypothetical protein
MAEVILQFHTNTEKVVEGFRKLSLSISRAMLSMLRSKWGIWQVGTLCPSCVASFKSKVDKEVKGLIGLEVPESLAAEKEALLEEWQGLALEVAGILDRYEGDNQ